MDKNETEKILADYLNSCNNRKNLSKKTIKAYSIDLHQFMKFIPKDTKINKQCIEKYIDTLHSNYKPKSVKRKIASLKAFFHYLELEELIDINPFHKIQIRYKEPFSLPKTIPLKDIEKIINYSYKVYNNANSENQKIISLRNILILELLFATGIRISELCSLNTEDIDFNDYIIKIHGKGSKERLVQICNKSIQNLIEEYINLRQDSDYMFSNRLKNRLSEQSARNMIKQYTKNAGINTHITPHMFRHSFATLLLEEDVDIRYIQQMLGHSSITTTQIYTHISMKKQRNILVTKHPRNKLKINYEKSE